MSFVWFNGNIMEYNSLQAVDVDRAWRYGDGGFETIFFNGKEAPLYEFHIRRATQHARLIDIEIDFPEQMDIKKILSQLAEKNNIKNTARCRISWFRNAGGFYLPTDDTGSVLIELSAFDSTQIKREQKAVLYNDQTLVAGKLSGFKKISAHVYTDAARFAKLMEADEAVLLNFEGRIAEATASNIIIREGNSFFAPPIQDGGIEGVMLYFLSKHLPEWGFHFARKSYTPNELLRVDEIMTVNALRGICCITSLFGKNYTSHSLELNERLPLAYSY